MTPHMSRLLRELSEALGRRGYRVRYTSVANGRIGMSLCHADADYVFIGVVTDHDAYVTWCPRSGEARYFQCPCFNKASRKARVLLNAARATK